MKVEKRTQKKDPSFSFPALELGTRDVCYLKNSSSRRGWWKVDVRFRDAGNEKQDGKKVEIRN